MMCACTQNHVWHTSCSRFRPFYMRPQKPGRTWRKLRLWHFNPILVEGYSAVRGSGLALACAGGREGEGWASIGCT